VFKKPNVIIYRDLLLLPSETFVRGQAEALQDFTPYYVGSRFTSGLSLPLERTFVVNNGSPLGKLSEITSRLGYFPQILTEQLQHLNPTLVHAHFGFDGTIALDLAKYLKIPLLVTFHGFDITVKDQHLEPSLGTWLYLNRRNALMRDAKLFVAVSDFIHHKLLEQGFPAHKIIRHYIGIDTELFKPDLNIERELTVLFVGRLVEKKGCEYLIRAMIQIQALVPGIRLVIIGDGPLRLFLENLAQKTLKHSQFLGRQPQSVVKSWMQRAKVFCVPSVTARTGDAEGFGLVFAEAQATGLPVVSFSSGGVPEAVAHGETGLLATERDVDGLVRHILQMLENNDLWQSFSRRGRKRVQKRFDLHRQTYSLEQIYNQLVSSSTRSSLIHCSR
jgi:colanic acid/amylovoran biosynthesis glycosyltransferase